MTVVVVVMLGWGAVDFPYLGKTRDIHIYHPPVGGISTYNF